MTHPPSPHRPICQSPPPLDLSLLSLLAFMSVATPSLAQTTATLGEKSIGTPCSNASASADYDTLAQCSATSGSGTMKKAPLFVGAVTSPPYVSTACDSTKAGMLEYTASGFQGCNGSAWSSLGTSGTGGQSMIAGWPDAIVCSNVNASQPGPAVFDANVMPNASSLYEYRQSTNQSTGDYRIIFNADGSFNSATTTLTSTCDSKSIATLISTGKAFNFVNGGANGAGAMADGTAGAPGLYFSADTNTGLYRPTADTLAIATAGSERLRVSATGSVGIGTTAPAANLDITGSSGSTLKVTDGNQALGKVLTSDATGNASWQYNGGMAVVTAGTAGTGTGLTLTADSAYHDLPVTSALALPSAGTYFISLQAYYTWSSGCGDIYTHLTGSYILYSSLDGKWQGCGSSGATSWHTYTFVVVVSAATTITPQYLWSAPSGSVATGQMGPVSAIRISQ